MGETRTSCKLEDISVSHHLQFSNFDSGGVCQENFGLFMELNKCLAQESEKLKLEDAADEAVDRQCEL